ncbi:MAG TPA: hypothetical protein VF529_03595 [Solirubrobacteraceae bacterium]|jgi:hypothetical protein
MSQDGGVRRDLDLTDAWRAQRLFQDALEAVTADETSYWLHRRVLFARAHAVRMAMCAGGFFDGRRPLLYAVAVRNQGCVYLGETLSRRRLWDIPVGESHHLAATFPPAAWERLVALRWSEVEGVVLPPSPGLHQAAGRALERELHIRLQPEMNIWTKRVDGRWGRRALRPLPQVDGFDVPASADAVEATLRDLLCAPADRATRDMGPGRIVVPGLLDITEHLDLGDPDGVDARGLAAGERPPGRVP